MPCSPNFSRAIALNKSSGSRDYLRTHPVVAAEYEKAKREILSRLGSEINQPAYNDAKAEFVHVILRGL
jgi:GrpB-like predicted nucleotidyltransferase (UPF0157 family)